MNDLLNILKKPYFQLIIFITLFLYLLSINYGKFVLNSQFEGDIGRDLYIYYITSKGMLPYINFNWIYGPLSPMLYGFIFKIFGVSILNAVSGWYITFIISTFLTYFIVAKMTKSFYGFLAGTMFYLNYGFFIQTFNHILGVPAILCGIYFYYKYLQDENRSKYLYMFAISIFFLAIVKLNMALVFAFSSFLPLIAYKLFNKYSLKPVYKSIALTLGLSASVYIPLIMLSPIDQLFKSFPYSKHYVMTLPFSFQKAMFIADAAQIIYIQFNNIFESKIYYYFSILGWFYLIMFGGLILSGYFIKKEFKFTTNLTFVIFLTLSAFLFSHEFLIVKTIYSVRFWCLPSCIILLFYILEYLFINKNNLKVIKYAVYSIIGLIIASIVSEYYVLSLYKNTNSYYFPYKRSQIAMVDYSWGLNTYAVLDFISKNIKKDEKMFSLPYNMFYNFMAEKDQPSRYTEFLYISGITESDERKIIQDLKQNNVKWILYGMKYGHIEGGVGYFGKTHCNILDKFIKDNYNVITVIYFKEEKERIAPVMFLKKREQNHS